VKRIDIANTALTEAEIEAVVRVLRSGMLRQGPQCEAFEQEFGKKVGAKFCYSNANGTAALHLAYMAFLKPGDEVLVPAFTFIATGSTVTMAGGKPVFCDVDPATGLLDLEDAERRITPKTRAIVPVHLFGNVCDIDRFKAFAARHKLVTVWDAAQAHGATWRGTDVGAFGDFACYSFYPTKNMFVGEGGITTTDNPEYAEKLKFMRSHGQTGRYVHTMLGLNYRMTDIEAAIGREQLKLLDQRVGARRRNAGILNESLSGVPGIRLLRVTPGAESSWHQFCIVVDETRFGCSRDALAEKLNARGIGTGIHYPRGLHQQPVFEELYGKQRLPNTEALAQGILALPVHHAVTADDARAVAAAVRESGG
jgi:perosamine synthetase